MSDTPPPTGRPSILDRVLNSIERIGNKLPDPAILFLILLIATWVASWLLAGQHDALNPKTEEPVEVTNLLTGSQLATFLAEMVQTFVGFHPLGVVLVAMLGVGVAEHVGFINAGLKVMLGITPQKLLTPMLVLVAIVSHTAADAGYVLVIPLGGVIFAAAGRHPLAGIAAAFAGVSGGFSANFIPSGIDPLLQGLTQAGAQVLDSSVQVNPLCNWGFTSLSSILVVLIVWFLTDKVIEPRLAGTPIDGDPEDMPRMEAATAAERRGLIAAGVAIVVFLAAFTVWSLLPESALIADAYETPAADGGMRPASHFERMTAFAAPLMQSIVPLIFLFFIVPAVVYGYAAGTVESHRDIVKGMSKAMSDMGYYLVMAFFAALFIEAFGDSGIGVLIAVTGADLLQSLGMPAALTIVGIILLTGGVNLLVGSASAKWALLSPIFVPMLMSLGFSPELTQAAYRVGDSATNIITPLMPYFPLVVVFCKRYSKGTGIGTLISLMLPYSVCLLIGWTLFLLAYWAIGLPLGLQATYTYTPGG